MPTPPSIDLESLLAPISDEAPTGADIREDSSPASVYYRLKDARSQARAAERASVEDGDEMGLSGEWRTILELSPKVLTSQAKDLEVAAWYAEALLRADGYAGLRDGFQLLSGLVERYWDDLFPMPDEDGIETRVAPLTGLNGTSSDGALIQPLRMVPLTLGSEGGFALWQYIKVTDPAHRQAGGGDGPLNMDALQRSARETPGGFFRTLLDDLDACIEAFKGLEGVLGAKAGNDSPPGGNIRNTLNAARDAVSDLGRDKLAALAQAEAAGVPVAEAPSEGGTMAPGAAVGTARASIAGGVVASREDAFRVLSQVADFFRKTEPHSPMSYTLDEVVRRGRMSLPELLQELIQDDETRKFFFIASGIKPPQPAGDQESDGSSSGW